MSGRPPANPPPDDSTPGERAAQIFDAFARGYNRNDIVRRFSVTPQEAQSLYEWWRDPDMAKKAESNAKAAADRRRMRESRQNAARSRGDQRAIDREIGAVQARTEAMRQRLAEDDTPLMGAKTTAQETTETDKGTENEDSHE